MRSDTAHCPTVHPEPERSHMVATPFTLRFPSTPTCVRRALSGICDHLAKAGANSETLSQVEIVLAEVLNNVVEHAMQHKDEGLIHIIATPVASGWRFEVTDEGVALPGGQIPCPPLPGTDRPLSDLPEGGFGWAIVNMLARDLRYVRRDGRNVLSFVMAAA